MHKAQPSTTISNNSSPSPGLALLVYSLHADPGDVQTAHTDIPAEVWQEIWRDVEARIEEFVTERLVPIYDQHLSHEDIKGLIVFYESPLGKKLLQVMPLMSQESMLAGQAWGRDFAESVQQKLPSGV